MAEKDSYIQGSRNKAEDIVKLYSKSTPGRGALFKVFQVVIATEPVTSPT